MLLQHNYETAFKLYGRSPVQSTNYYSSYRLEMEKSTDVTAAELYDSLPNFTGWGFHSMHDCLQYLNGRENQLQLRKFPFTIISTICSAYIHSRIHTRIRL